MTENNLYIGNAGRHIDNLNPELGAMISDYYPIIASSSKEASEKLIIYLNSHHKGQYPKWEKPKIRELRSNKGKVSLKKRLEIIKETSKEILNSREVLK